VSIDGIYESLDFIMLTQSQIDNIKNEIMRRTDITACLNEDEFATFFEVCELAKESVDNDVIIDTFKRICTSVAPCPLEDLAHFRRTAFNILEFLPTFRRAALKQLDDDIAEQADEVKQTAREWSVCDGDGLGSADL